MSVLLDLFNGLALPDLSVGSSEAVFSAMPMTTGHERHIGKDMAGRPLILLSLRSQRHVSPNYALEHLRIEHDLPCRIIGANGKSSNGRFSLIRCLSDDNELQRYFLRIVEMLFDTLPEDASMSDVSKAIEHLISLFRALQQPPSKSIQGLWAELFLIASSRDPLVMLQTWRNDSREEIDFSDGERRLEVKCSGDGSRRHYFSLEQLDSPAGATLVIASLLTERSTGGTGILELWDRVRDIAAGNSDLLLKIEKACISALGHRIQSDDETKYDENRARGSLTFFDAREVPKVSPDLPSGVSDVHFRSDLSLAQPLSHERMKEWGGILACCLPQ